MQAAMQPTAPPAVPLSGQAVQMSVAQSAAGKLARQLCAGLVHCNLLEATLLVMGTQVNCRSGSHACPRVHAGCSRPSGSHLMCRTCMLSNAQSETSTIRVLRTGAKASRGRPPRASRAKAGAKRKSPPAAASPPVAPATRRQQSRGTKAGVRAATYAVMPDSDFELDSEEFDQQESEDDFEPPRNKRARAGRSVMCGARQHVLSPQATAQLKREARTCVSNEKCIQQVAWYMCVL
jgi:hypothetical protein